MILSFLASIQSSLRRAWQQGQLRMRQELFCYALMSSETENRALYSVKLADHSILLLFLIHFWYDLFKSTGDLN